VSLIPACFRLWQIILIIQFLLSKHFYVFINVSVKSVISGFRRDVDEICALLGYYTASNGNPLPTFRDKIFLGLFDPGIWDRYAVSKRRQRFSSRRCVIPQKGADLSCVEVS
jgi:hypothetical protein